jgi:hypothetical protein
MTGITTVVAPPMLRYLFKRSTAEPAPTPDLTTTSS